MHRLPRLLHGLILYRLKRYGSMAGVGAQRNYKFLLESSKIHYNFYRDKDNKCFVFLNYFFSFFGLTVDSDLTRLDIVVLESGLSVKNEDNNDESVLEVLEIAIFGFSAINDQMFNDLIETISHNINITFEISFAFPMDSIPNIGHN